MNVWPSDWLAVVRYWLGVALGRGVHCGAGEKAEEASAGALPLHRQSKRVYRWEGDLR